MIEGKGSGGIVETRWSRRADAAELADVHRVVWRYTYAGIIPGVQLERMISHRGPRWWERMHGRGMKALVLTHGPGLAGYATFGRPRVSVRGGEIYELYVRPEMHGLGFGRRLFGESRRQLASHGLRKLTVWALAENEIACRFYRAVGGVEAGRSLDRMCGVPLQKVAFIWNDGPGDSR